MSEEYFETIWTDSTAHHLKLFQKQAYWKVAKITMIEKDKNERNDSNKYRPISVTNSIVNESKKPKKELHLSLLSPKINF